MTSVTRATNRLDPHNLGIALAAAFAIFCVWLNPIGYIGGGNDDGQYLDAARCWVANGAPCVPHSHWWSRWPTIAPIAVNLTLFGETRAALGVGAAAYWAVTLCLAYGLTTLWFGRGAALVTTFILAATPVITAPALQPTVDIPEVMFHLAALATATIAFRRQDGRIAVAAGALAGLALQARDTSFVFLAMSSLAWLFLPSERRKILLWAIAGLLLVVVLEMIVYAAATGDALYRYKLAIGHVALPTDQLPAGFEIGQRPFFNPAYIAAWKREVDIHWWWPIDPWLNLLASPKVGQIFFALALLSLLFWKKLRGAEKNHLAVMLGCAGCGALALTYGLAIDPKSRMFMDLVMACAIATGALAMAGWRSGGRVVVVTVVAMTAVTGMRALSLYPSTVVAEEGARRWIAQYGADIEIDDNSRAYLRLVPSARTLPKKGSGRPYRIAVTLGTCRDYVAPKAGQSAKARVIDWKGGPNPLQGRMCLLEYLPPRGQSRAAS